jgi:hypothetical protein
MPQAAQRGARRSALAAAIFLVVGSGAAHPRAAFHHACDFYRQLDRRCGCKPDTYFTSYGARYCERFMGAPGWSPAGERWRARTLACLKGELFRFVSHAHTGCDCAAVKDFAFASHGRCYTQAAASVCRLPLTDIAHIYALVDATDLIAPLGSGQALAITLSCVWQNGSAGARPDTLR